MKNCIVMAKYTATQEGYGIGWASRPLPSGRGSDEVNRLFRTPFTGRRTKNRTSENSAFHGWASCVTTLILVAGLCWTSTAFAAPIDPNNPPQGRFSDDWMEVFLGNNKVGFGHSLMSREGDRVRTELTVTMKLGRADQPVTISVKQGTLETLQGVPIEFFSEADLSVAKTMTKGTVKDGKVTVVNTQFGMETTNSYDYPKGAVMSWGQYRETILRGFKAGTEYSLDVYAPDLRLDGPAKAVTKIGEVEKFDHRGTKREGRRVTVDMSTPLGAISLVSWTNEDGEPIKSTLPMPGIGDFTLYTCDEAVALAEFAPPEFFMNTVIPAKQKLERGSIRQIKYVIRSKKVETPVGDLPNTGMQKADRQSDGSIALNVTRQSHTAKSSGGAKLSDEALAEFLGSNLMINTADPTLVELAKTARGDAKEPFAIGDNLRKFVTEHIGNKSLNIGFATASEVARTREGDCSEHGILLAALGRLNKTPSRVVVGLAYVPFFGRQDDIFGYHMWTQFYIDGEWVDFDAALRETECSPARIAFATSSLKDAGLADLSLPLLGIIGAIDMDIVEIDGKPVGKPAPSGKP